LAVIAGAGDDTVSATGITSGSATLDLGAGDNEITLGTNLAAAEISITTGAGDDTITMDGDAADTADISIALGAGTNRLILAADADLTGYTLSLTGLSEIELAAADDDAVIDSELLDGASVEILSSAAAGTASALLGVNLADGTTSFDGSSLTISDSISTAALGLIVTVDTAADDFTIIGSEGADTITTGTGDDAITGGSGVDTMDGGTGDNVYIIGDDDSGITAATADSIAAFVSGDDTLSLGAAGTSTNYNEATTDVANFAAALTAADALFLADAGDLLYAFQTDGTDGWLFEDTDGDGDSDLVIVLTGVDETEFAMADIVA